MGKWILIFVFACTVAPALADSDQDEVRALLHSSFDSKGAALDIDPIVVADSYAIAGWTQGDMGGRALLRRRDGKWILIMCAGDAIKSADALRRAGLSADTADSLTQKLQRSEATLGAGRLEMFARFEGLVRMDESGKHPSARHQNH
ncbi:MAG: copper uptake system-associated protein [Rhizobiales bacterium]|nr:copper uptake system-associated protein [Hyphomicrobiales bacterium]